MSTLLQDLRYSAQLLWNKRAYSITVTLMLGLGIGSFTSVFSVADAVLLKSYGPVRTDQWVYLWEHRTKSASLNQISVGELPRLEERVHFVVFGSHCVAAVELHGVWRRCEQSRTRTCRGDFTGSVHRDSGGTCCGTLVESGRQFERRSQGGAELRVLETRLWRGRIAPGQEDNFEWRQPYGRRDRASRIFFPARGSG